MHKNALEALAGGAGVGPRGGRALSSSKGIGPNGAGEHLASDFGGALVRVGAARRVP